MIKYVVPSVFLILSFNIKSSYSFESQLENLKRKEHSKELIGRKSYNKTYALHVMKRYFDIYKRFKKHNSRRVASKRSLPKTRN